MQLPFRFLILVISFILVAGEDFENDPNGYIMFCPCMGRFGNQADHFLGALSLAKALNRTLVLPHWVEFRKGAPRSTQIPFDTYFQVDPLQEYHRVILMADFMKHLAPQVWPAERRVSFCYMERKQLQPQSPVEKPDCHAKDGNPFGPFWDTFNVSFVGSEFYKPLHFDVHYSNVAESWRTRFHPSAWPVLAFTGAPATFPLQSENRELQRYLKWNEKYQQLAREFIRSQLPRGAFIGIHLRNGIDWVRACEHVRDSNQLFASPQCLGYKNEKGQLYPELCYPSKEAIIRQLKRLVKNVRMMHPANEVRSIFVASDSNHMIAPLNEAFQRMNITAHKLPEDHPHLDLAILGQSNHFVGNCISSFSSFVKRERDVNGLPSYFWAFPKEKERHHGRAHEEL